jgi:hypothetical protein
MISAIITILDAERNQSKDELCMLPRNSRKSINKAQLKL